MNPLRDDFARALDPVELARQALGMEPDPWQSKLLRSSADRVLVLASRQAGKTVTLGLAALHAALYEPGALVLVVSASERQARELFRVAVQAYRSLGRPVASEGETALELRLESGSRVIVLPATSATIRGYSRVRLLIVDEAAQVSDDTYATVRPMLAVSGGRLVAASTPYGRRGWFFEAWHGPEPWERYRVPASECPRISSAFLAEEERALGPWWFRQEYLCEFLADETAAFDPADVARAVDPEVDAWNDLIPTL